VYNKFEWAQRVKSIGQKILREQERERERNKGKRGRFRGGEMGKGDGDIKRIGKVGGNES
jgi:hypothetical protein